MDNFSCLSLVCVFGFHGGYSAWAGRGNARTLGQ